jgi:hypothetical protein
VGIEPTHKGFADLSLTTWVPRRQFLSITKICMPCQHAVVVGTAKVSFGYPAPPSSSRLTTAFATGGKFNLTEVQPV